MSLATGIKPWTIVHLNLENGNLLAVTWKPQVCLSMYDLLVDTRR